MSAPSPEIKKLQEQHTPEERLLWHYTAPAINPIYFERDIPLSFLIIFSLLIALGGFALIATWTAPLAGQFVIGFAVVFFFFQLINDKNKKITAKEVEYYFITQGHICSSYADGRTEKVRLGKVHSFEVVGGELYFSGNNKRRHVMRRVNLSSDDYYKVKEIVEERGMYATTAKKLKNFAQKHDLKEQLSLISPKNKSVTFTGNKDGIDFKGTLLIGGIMEGEMKITCRNPADLYFQFLDMDQPNVFQIQRPKFVPNDPYLNEAYEVATNKLEIAQELLDKYPLGHLNRKTVGGFALLFGKWRTPPKPRAQEKIKDTADVLDMHMMDRSFYTNTLIVDKNQRSVLSFSFKVRQLDGIDLFSNAYDTLTALAKEVSDLD